MSKQKNSSYVIDILHLFIFCSFVIAQPLYDLLSQYGNFFVARKSSPGDIVTLTLFLSILLPAALALVEIVFGLVSEGLRRVFHYAIAALFLALFALQLLKKVEALPGTLIIILAILSGIAFTIIYIRSKGMRRFLTILAPSIIIFPVYFLFFTPINKLVSPEKKYNKVYKYDSVEIKSDIPIVFVIFDELTLVALLDEENKIDPVRYPNFSAFSKESYWFRNYSVNSPFTMISIPTLLSGRFVEDYVYATFNQFPENIFNLLGDSYDINAVESSTRLCRPELNTSPLAQAPVKHQLASTIMDLSVVYSHIVLPRQISEKLPVITSNWGNFVSLSNEKGKGDKKPSEVTTKSLLGFRLRLFDHFIQSIKPPEKRPSLNFIHAVIPHVPYEYFPSGNRYTKYPPPGRDRLTGEWSENEWLVTQGYQRFLLQVGAVDTKIGDLISHLKEIGLYDKSLIVLTADHGTLLKANSHNRQGDEHTYESDLMTVPLFMKLPHQKEGIINDDNVESIDVLPTIADLLDIELPWEVDGRSFFDKATPLRPTKTFYVAATDEGPKQIFYYRDKNESRYKESLDKKLATFGSGRTKPNGLYAFGPYSELAGKRVEEFVSTEQTALRVIQKQGISYTAEDMKQYGFLLPLCISSMIVDDQNILKDEEIDIAVSVNGIIQTLTRSYKTPRLLTSFYSMLPESVFKVQSIDLAFYAVRKGDGGKVELMYLPEERYDALKYYATLSYGEKERYLVPGHLDGWVDEARIEGEKVTVKGWAADLNKNRPPDSVVMFVDNKPYAAQTGLKREDISRRYGKESILKSGFKITFPAGLIDENSKVSVVAISGSLATHLKYGKETGNKLNLNNKSNYLLLEDAKNLPKQIVSEINASKKNQGKLTGTKKLVMKEVQRSKLYDSIYKNILKKKTVANK